MSRVYALRSRCVLTGQLLTVLLASLLAACQPSGSESTTSSATSRSTGAEATAPAPRAVEGVRRLPGDFEPPAAVVLAIGRKRNHPLEKIVFSIARAAAADDLPVLILAPKSDDAALAAEAIRRDPALSRTGRVQILDHDTPWIRDFGPQFVARHRPGSLRPDSGRALAIDFMYECAGEPPPRHPADARVPVGLTPTLGVSREYVPTLVHGGNLISNGQGLGITTARTVNDNRDFRGVPETRVTGSIKSALGLEELVILLPLHETGTHHVDQIAAFTSPDTLVLSRIDPGVDPVNANILEQNARRLSGVRYRGRPLRVVRLPLPRGPDGTWRTFTNVVFLKTRLLMPSYRDIAPRFESQAIRTYRRLLPRRRLQTLDCTVAIQMQGALRCLSLVVPGFVPLPSSLTARPRAAGR